MTYVKTKFERKTMKLEKMTETTFYIVKSNLTKPKSYLPTTIHDSFIFK